MSESKDDFPTLNNEVIDALPTKKAKALAILNIVLHSKRMFGAPGMKAKAIYLSGQSFFERSQIDPGFLRTTLHGAKKQPTSRIVSPRYTRYYLDIEPDSFSARNMRENLLYPALCTHLSEMLKLECFSPWYVRGGDSGENPDITALSVSNPSIRIEHAIEVKSRLKLLREGFNLALGYQDLAYHASVVVAVCGSQRNNRFIYKIKELAARRGLGFFVAIIEDQDYRAFVIGNRHAPFEHNEIDVRCLAMPKKTDPACNLHNDYLVRLGVASPKDLDKWLRKRIKNFNDNEE